MQKIHTVKIILASDIDANTQKRIESFISKKHQKSLTIERDNFSMQIDIVLKFEYEVDKSILGGLLIIDGDEYYDGTLKNQLLQVRKALNW